MDRVAVSGVQLKMLSGIPEVYGVDSQENHGKAVIGALVGTPSMVAFCGAPAYALGKVFIQPEKVRDHSKEQFEEGAKVAAKLEETEGAETVA